MVVVVVFGVLTFLGGLVVGALLVRRLFHQVKSLGSTVAAAAARVGEASEQLETIAPRDR